MAATYYKYAERDADSQVNWAEVGKGLSDMLAETNRVRQEKKDALDEAQRETMKYLAETPNGEHVGARQSILEYANIGSNQMRIWDNLLKSGQLDPKDYTINRQNLIDNTNLAFNANKLYQEKYSDVMKGVADKKYSQLYADNFAEVEGFGNWKNIGWQIAPNGTVMAGKMVEEEVDGKKVRTLDKTPGGLRSMDYLNQALVSQVDFYNYEDKVNAWVETLGKEKKVTTILGKIQKQGKITSVDDITSRKDIVDADKKIMFTFLQAENDQLASIVGDPKDAARVLVDSTIFAPNRKQYRSTTSEEDAKKNPEAILKVVDPDTGGFKYVISKEQQEDVNEFVRGQMRAKYNYEEDAQVVGAVSRDEPRPPTQTELDRQDMEQDAENFALNTSYILTGTDAQKAQGMAYMRSRGADIISNPPGKPAGNYIRTKQGLVAFESKGDKVAALRGITGALLTATGASFPEDMVVNKAKGKLGKVFNTKYTGTGATLDIDTEAAKKVTKVTNVNLFTSQNSNDTAASLKRELGKIPGLKITQSSKGKFKATKGNKITISKPGAEDLIINSNESGADAELQAKNLKDWLANNLSDDDKAAMTGQAPAEKKATGELDD